VRPAADAAALGTVRRPPVELGVPVAGRWQALNSPADKVPSHGRHAYGQTYAVDLAHEPVDGSRPEFGAGPSFRPPADYPAFGQPVLAPADGVVVRATGASGTTAAAAPGRACST
jgi:murein DD-endopeptidase MepM/ murein hydrolase activator NlpD